MSKKFEQLIANQDLSYDDFLKYYDYCIRTRSAPPPCDNCKFKRDCELLTAFEHEVLPADRKNYVECPSIVEFIMDFNADREDE